MAVITTPTTIDNIASVLRISTTNAAVVMRPDLFGFGNNMINKWAKNKPIHHTNLFKLQGDEIKGLVSDIQNGIVYGLKTGVSGKILKNVHTADWSYVGKPQGDINVSPFRLWDYVGYDSEAAPTLWAEGLFEGGSVVAQQDNPITVTFFWNDTNNTTGIPLDGVLGTNFASLYAYIMIDDYATMLLNGSGYYPILNNGAKSKTFICPTLPSALKPSADATRKVTVFLAPLDTTMRGTWVQWSSTNVTTYNVCTLPYGVGINITFKFQESVVEIVRNFTGTFNDSNTAITYSFSKGNDFDRYSGKMCILVSVYQVGSNGKEIAPQDSTVIPITSATSYTSLVGDLMTTAGWVGGFGTYNIYAYARYQDGSGNWQTQTFIKNTKTY